MTDIDYNSYNRMNLKPIQSQIAFLFLFIMVGTEVMILE